MWQLALEAHESWQMSGHPNWAVLQKSDEASLEPKNGAMFAAALQVMLVSIAILVMDMVHLSMQQSSHISQGLRVLNSQHVCPCQHKYRLSKSLFRLLAAAVWRPIAVCCCSLGGCCMQGTPGTEGSSVGTQQTQPQPQPQLGNPPLPGIAVGSVATTSSNMDMGGNHTPAFQAFHHAELRHLSGSNESEEGRQVKRLRQQQGTVLNVAGVSLALHSHTTPALVSQLAPSTRLEGLPASAT